MKQVEIPPMYVNAIRRVIGLDGWLFVWISLSDAKGLIRFLFGHGT